MHTYNEFNSLFSGVWVCLFLEEHRAAKRRSEEERNKQYHYWLKDVNPLDVPEIILFTVWNIGNGNENTNEKSRVFTIIRLFQFTAFGKFIHPIPITE